MIKIGVLDVDGISGALNILSTEGQRDFAGIECERLSLLIPHVSYTIPEIILVTVFNIDIRQWPIEVGLTEVYSLFQSWFYRPLPHVYIEHGNQNDFWNCITDMWDEQGQPLTFNPSKITLPLGTQYIQRAAYPINVQYPYFDHFEPAMNLTPQVALLCLLNPEIVITTVQHAMGMLSYSSKPFAGLALEEENHPVRLFELAMREFATFQEDLVVQHPDFIEPLGETTRVDAMLELAAIREALSLPFIDAIK